MLNEGLEPNIMSYTTTISACTKEGMKNPSRGIDVATQDEDA
jgi:hypothetical protein